jgi:hypothetical protein
MAWTPVDRRQYPRRFSTGGIGPSDSLTQLGTRGRQLGRFAGSKRAVAASGAPNVRVVGDTSIRATLGALPLREPWPSQIGLVQKAIHFAA